MYSTGLTGTCTWEVEREGQIQGPLAIGKFKARLCSRTHNLRNKNKWGKGVHFLKHSIESKDF